MQSWEEEKDKVSDQLQLVWSKLRSPWAACESKLDRTTATVKHSGSGDETRTRKLPSG